MAMYVFKAMDLAGVPASGEVEAVSKQDVAEQLKERGLVVIDIANKYRSKELNIEVFARVKAGDLAVATRQLSTMVSSGMTILRALYVLETQTKSKVLRDALADVRRDVEAGLLLSDALERHPKVFGPLYVSMVRAGETGGVLEESMLRTADQLEKDASLRRQIRAAMIYPTLVISFAVIVLLALVAFLIPVFENVFKEFPGKLPALSAFMVGFSHLLTKQWYLLILFVVRRRERVLVRQALEMGAPPLGCIQASGPDEDRRRSAKGGDRPLVAHFLGAGHGWRADHPGDRDHRPDRRQRMSSSPRWRT